MEKRPVRVTIIDAAENPRSFERHAPLEVESRVLDCPWKLGCD
jgi:hypothetical protein